MQGRPRTASSIGAENPPVNHPRVSRLPNRRTGQGRPTKVLPWRIQRAVVGHGVRGCGTPASDGDLGQTGRAGPAQARPRAALLVCITLSNEGTSGERAPSRRSARSAADPPVITRVQSGAFCVVRRMDTRESTAVLLGMSSWVSARLASSTLERMPSLLKAWRGCVLMGSGDRSRARRSWPGSSSRSPQA
jgi:hypothetical protein